MQAQKTGNITQDAYFHTTTFVYTECIKNDNNSCLCLKDVKPALLYCVHSFAIWGSYTLTVSFYKM